MRKMGICMEGLEEQFEALLKRACDQVSGNIFAYMEIGIAYGQTIHAAFSILEESIVRHPVCLGVDPNPNLDFLFKLYEGAALVVTNEDAVWSAYHETIIIRKQMGDVRLLPERLNFVFVDGCHSHKCSMADFKKIELDIEPGGIVVFHDFGERSQDQDPQPHCNGAKIGVRQATIDLGLFNNTRAGWTRLPDLIGQTSDCGVFQKTK